MRVLVISDMMNGPKIRIVSNGKYIIERCEHGSDDWIFVDDSESVRIAVRIFTTEIKKRARALYESRNSLRFDDHSMHDDDGSSPV